MKKNFFKLSLILNVSLALLSAIFMFIYAYYDSVYDGEAFFTFLGYVKTFFDLLAVFVGYATIIYAFVNFDFKNGMLAIGAFSASVFISFVTMIIGSSISYSTKFTLDFFMSVLFYSAGSCFITQFIPALLIAFVAHHFAKSKAKTEIIRFFSWKNPAQRTMILTTLFLFGFNVLFYTFASVLPFLIEEGFSVHMYQFVSILVDYIDKVVFYLLMQYLVYFFTYKIYSAYAIKHPEK